MFSLRNYTIKTRLFALAGLAILTMLIIGGDGLWSLTKSRSTFVHYVDNEVEGLTQLANVRAGVGNLRRYEKDQLINLADAKAVEKYRKDWSEAYDKVRAGLETMDKLELPANIKDAPKQLLQSLAQYKEGMNSVGERLSRGEFTDTASANIAMEPIKGSVRAIDKQLGELTTLIDEHSNTQIAQLDQQQQSVRLALMGMLAVGVLAVGFFTFFNIRSILRPLDRAVASAERIARQDLSESIDAEGVDETAVMMRGVQGMQRSLYEVVSNVRSSTDSIATASAEVAAGGQDLSMRTEQTASNLEETASAMEQLTASVTHNAESARKADELARSAATVAQRGGAVVGEVVVTMNRISASSGKIADIIGTIDGIAFQTNILALNAAVEAARAGEQGRGFAVVAGEVRVLAQRSAAAAKEIKDLITASGENVTTGAQLVERAGLTMQEIVSAIERVTGIVGEISTASREQSTGINQIGQAIANLDQMTQSNAALVEQSAAAAQSLQQQADELARSVAVFKLA